MRIFAMLIMTTCLLAGVASAATVNLNDGRAVQGNILRQDNKSLQISVDGVTMTYYADEIKDIDGQPFASALAAEPAAVPQPDTVAPTPVAQSEASAVQGTGNMPAAIDPEKKALILKFMDVFGTRQALSNNFETMLAQIAKEKPDEAQTIRQRVKIDEIVERLLPIYDRNFTSEDLKAFIAFYGSTDGQKLIQTIPELMKESVAESIKYMQEKFPEVQKGQ